MRYFIYDGSFEGFLTAVYEYFHSEQRPDKIVKESDYVNSLFAEAVTIHPDADKADRVYNSVRQEISRRSLRRIYYGLLSEQNGVESLILKYLQLGFRIGRRIDDHLTDQTVLKLAEISRKVGGEKHRLLGLVRFREMENGIYYAPIEPDYNIVTLLAPHFSRRLSDQNWIIHDLKRETAAIYNQEEWLLTGLKKEEVSLSRQEEVYQSLWQGFFSSISIENRKNPRLQKQYMPVRYWKHLIEK